MNDKVTHTSSRVTLAVHRSERWRLSQLRYPMRAFLRCHPLLYLPLSRWRWSRWHSKNGFDGPCPANWDTDLVIEGFPRSASTFASYAFRLAQPKPVKIAYNLHAPAQIIAASKMNVPTLVLIRDPKDAILSVLAFDREIPATRAVKDYITFYTHIQSYRDHFVLATFDSVITDFGMVIRDVNRKFKTSFHIFKHIPENVEKCFKQIEHRNRRFNRGEVSEETVQRPSAKRQQLKDELVVSLSRSDVANRLAQAQMLYQDFVGAVDN